jgi:glycosyltransferase involved in cell wall biosynthesis
MLRFTLVVPTLGRTTELETLFASFAAQEYPGLDCVLVDQNDDERLAELVARWGSVFPILRLRCTPGVSRARNFGLQQAKGDIVAFPDDDCWYPPALLKGVGDWFEQHPAFDILTVGAKDEVGASSGNRWVKDVCEIRPINAFRTTFCSSIFIRRTEGFRRFRFDESIGPGAGTRYGCGEETEYILQRLGHGERGHFSRALSVGHPVRDMLSGQVEGGRAKAYGNGMGYVLRRHSLGFLGAAFVMYDLARSVIVMLKGDFKASKLCLQHGWGIAAGYVTAPAPPIVRVR